MNDEGVAAVLGLVVVDAGGEIRIPYEAVEKGLPAESAVRVYRDEQSNELVVKIAGVEEQKEVEDGQ